MKKSILTPQEKTAIKWAFEDIESFCRTYSCTALATRKDGLDSLYASFFGQRYGDEWDFSDLMDEEWCGESAYRFNQAKIQARLMMLATFYVLAGEI